MKNDARLFSALLLLLFIGAAKGSEQGEVTVSPVHNYDIDLTTVDEKNNFAGATLTPSSWDNSGYYTATVHCPDQSIRQQPRYYAAITDMPPSAINPGFFRFNDYFDVKVEVFVVDGGGGTTGNENNNGKMHTVPFLNQSNNTLTNCQTPYTTDSKVYSGSKGRVTFRVTKPLINGISVSGYQIVKIYGRQADPAVLMNSPMTTVTIRSGIITVPDKCVVNNGKPLYVEFGDIPDNSKQLDGNNYVQPVPISIACSGGSFETGNPDIKLSVLSSGSGLASFDTRYLGTTGSADRRDLGIVLKAKADNSVVVPGTFYNLEKLNNNRGLWELQAAPIARPGSEIPEGEFSASASVVAEFQ